MVFYWMDNKFDKFVDRLSGTLFSGQFSKSVAITERFSAGRLGLDQKLRNLSRGRFTELLDQTNKKS